MVSDSDRLSATGEAVSWNPVPDAEQRQPRRACKRRSWQYMNVGVYVFKCPFLVLSVPVQSHRKLLYRLASPRHSVARRRRLDEYAARLSAGIALSKRIYTACAPQRHLPSFAATTL